MGTVGRTAAVLVAAVLVTAGCASRPDRVDAAGVSSLDGATASVTRADITTVVTVPALVTPGPTVELTSPEAGAVTRFTSRTIEFSGESGTTTVALPAGVSMGRHLVEVGRRLPAQYPIAQARLDGFGLVATLDPAALYRFYVPVVAAKGQISNGPGPFDCPLAHSVPTFAQRRVLDGPAPDETAAPAGQFTVTCVVPPELTLFSGMPAVIAATTSDVRDVLTLPVEAVAGSVQRGRVLLDGPDGLQEREVTLGPTDGVRIQVVTGLAEGDRVRVPGPDLAVGASR